MSSFAMDASLPQSERHSTSLLDLPNELLIKIAGLADYEVIRNLRLVCSRLDHIAARFLAQEITVKQTQESLDDVQRLLKKPHLAAGVRAITVVLGYRFSPLALDKSLFTQVAEDKMLDHLSIISSSRRPSESDSEYRRRNLQEKRDMFTYSGAWREDKWPQLRVDETRPNDAMEKYEQLLQSAYDIYKKEYDETSRIASERSLVLALVKLVSFAKHPVTLSFAKDYDRYERIEAPGPETMVLECMEDIPSLFSLQERYRKPVEDDMTLLDGIIWDLPIALHQAGCIVHGLFLRNVLKVMGDAMLFADALSPGNDKLNQLRQALQNLTEFSIIEMMHMKMDTTDNPDLNHVEEPTAERPKFGDLLRTYLSGPGLKSVQLDGNSGSDWATWADPPRSRATRNHLTPVVTNINVAHMNLVGISCVPMVLSDGTVVEKNKVYVWSEGHLTDKIWFPEPELV